MLINQINELPSSPLRLAHKHGLCLGHQDLVQLPLDSVLLVRVHDDAAIALRIILVIPLDLLVELIYAPIQPRFYLNEALGVLAQLLQVRKLRRKDPLHLNVLELLQVHFLRLEITNGEALDFLIIELLILLGVVLRRIVINRNEIRMLQRKNVRRLTVRQIKVVALILDGIEELHLLLSMILSVPCEAHSNFLDHLLRKLVFECLLQTLLLVLILSDLLWYHHLYNVQYWVIVSVAHRQMHQTQILRNEDILIALQINDEQFFGQLDLLELDAQIQPPMKHSKHKNEVELLVQVVQRLLLELVARKLFNSIRIVFEGWVEASVGIAKDINTFIFLEDVLDLVFHGALLVEVDLFLDELTALLNIELLDILPESHFLARHHLFDSLINLSQYRVLIVLQPVLVHYLLEAVLITSNDRIINVLFILYVYVLHADACQEHEGLQDLRDEHLEHGLPVQQRVVAQLGSNTHY